MSLLVVKLRLALLGLIWICMAVVPIVTKSMVLEPIFFFVALYFIISKDKLVTLKEFSFFAAYAPVPIMEHG